ncbi:MAG: HAD-superfamily hydrolase [Candidatus Peregrinibacteria bacterium GW2011_GWF2_33_10]|nr:MAG: HAD-superfamily hydrolase [Candidatus Peregrinibacteria bacterium GW2011_GWF2_33_10]OGJ46106.1 MAG: hypothetical protein A2272_05265 [Candidatus Peregrinibacteria bacterium RIFOXYA12_FULL_33_12]OGJ46189.1 MAG: hypothetical protein A2263_04860 [Candidatus Peregrinibacteria bacterium RIFOXYA2_FULL_33_21]OGJ51605.1 MAG: hypothetical protein A2307_04030 [Candidatus Peregrinibacteria bacterium RIFOXYB2_FULL_33_20]
MIKAIIFDMDGVIADSEFCHIDAEIKTMKIFGVDLTKEELEGYTGTTSKYMYEHLKAKHDFSASFEEFFEIKRQFLFEDFEKFLKPVDGVIDLIKNLHKKGFKLALASSSHRKAIDYILKKFEIYKFFDAITSSEEIQNSKPDPEIFLKSAEKLKFLSTECVVIEDAKLGVEGAKRAGMKCIGFKSHSSHQDLSMADWVVGSFEKEKILKFIL